MNFIRNILAIIGVITVAAAIWTFYIFYGFDSEAFATYKTMFTKLAKTGSPAAATVWRTKVADGVSLDDVVQSIKAIAEERNIKSVGELPLGDQVGAMEGKPWRKLNIYLYCNPLTAKKMVEFDPAYAAYLPCRVSLVEDENKQLWLYTLDMDMMIHGGKPLPPALLKEALHVKDIMRDILKRAAAGDF